MFSGFSKGKSPTTRSCNSRDASKDTIFFDYSICHLNLVQRLNFDQFFDDRLNQSFQTTLEKIKIKGGKLIIETQCTKIFVLNWVLNPGMVLKIGQDQSKIIELGKNRFFKETNFPKLTSIEIYLSKFNLNQSKLILEFGKNWHHRMQGFEING